MQYNHCGRLRTERGADTMSCDNLSVLNMWTRTITSKRLLFIDESIVLGSMKIQFLSFGFSQSESANERLGFFNLAPLTTTVGLISFPDS